MIDFDATHNDGAHDSTKSTNNDYTTKFYSNQIATYSMVKNYNKQYRCNSFWLFKNGLQLRCKLLHVSNEMTPLVLSKENFPVVLAYGQSSQIKMDLA